MESTTTPPVKTQQILCALCVGVEAGSAPWFLHPGAVLVFLPGLAEIKMLYEQLMSNRMFNNRGSRRSRMLHARTS